MTKSTRSADPSLQIPLAENCSAVSTCSSRLPSCTSPQVPLVFTLLRTFFRSPTPLARLCISPRALVNQLEPFGHQLEGFRPSVFPKFLAAFHRPSGASARASRHCPPAIWPGAVRWCCARPLAQLIGLGQFADLPGHRFQPLFQRLRSAASCGRQSPPGWFAADRTSPSGSPTPLRAAPRAAAEDSSRPAAISSRKRRSRRSRPVEQALFRRRVAFSEQQRQKPGQNQEDEPEIGVQNPIHDGGAHGRVSAKAGKAKARWRKVSSLGKRLSGDAPARSERRKSKAAMALTSALGNPALAQPSAPRRRLDHRQSGQRLLAETIVATPMLRLRRAELLFDETGETFFHGAESEGDQMQHLAPGRAARRHQSTVGTDHLIGDNRGRRRAPEPEPAPTD